MAKKYSRRRSKTVLTFLLASIFAPILYYTDRRSGLTDSIPSSEFTEKDFSLVSLHDNAKLSVITQESTGAVHEPSHETYSESLTNTSTKSKVASDKLISQGEHKSRVLSATNEVSNLTNDSEKLQNKEHNIESNFGKDNKILQVVNGWSTANGFRENTAAENIKEIGSRKTETLIVQMNPENKHEKPSQEVNSRRSRPDKKGSIKTKTLPNSMVLRLRDQLVRAKVYVGLGSSRSHPTFIRELRGRIREIQRVLGDATRDSELPKNAYEKLKAVEQTLSKGKLIEDNCSAATKKLRAILHSTEEQLGVYKKQSTFLSQLTAKTMPKGLHCLPLRLTNEYYINGFDQKELTNQEKLEDNELNHYAIFSDNVLAAAVVVNSTVSHAKNPEKNVFHIVTDKLNYAAIKMWFISNPPGNATIQVTNIEDFKWLTSSYSPVLKQLKSKTMIEYYFKSHHADENLKYHNPKYLSILNHLRFYLPEIFPKLNKVLFLDDDVVVQKDLSALWKVDLKGKVIGVVETCGESFHRFDRYLNFSNPLISQNFDPHACGWAFGMNMFDLAEWRRQNITSVYHSWQNSNQERLLWKLGTLPVGLVTFWNRTVPLDHSWHLLGLGYNPNMNHKDIAQAAVIHFNGNLKPWLEIGLPEYRKYWSKYVDHDQVYLRECNLSP
ncbi:putative galacturonosyltransferase 4 isoform X2 [Carex rostrata]